MSEQLPEQWYEWHNDFGTIQWVCFRKGDKKHAAYYPSGRKEPYGWLANTMTPGSWKPIDAPPAIVLEKNPELRKPDPLQDSEVERLRLRLARQIEHIEGMQRVISDRNDTIRELRANDDKIARCKAPPPVTEARARELARRCGRGWWVTDEEMAEWKRWLTQGDAK